MKAICKVLKTVSTVMLSLMIVLAVLLVGLKFLGFEIYTVLSGSMEPALHTGSVIYVRETDTDALEVGDIITYRLSGSTTATHRIIEEVADEGTVRFRTKGDANDAADGALVDKSQIVGKPLFSVPYLGYLAAYLQTKSGKFMAIAFCAAVILLTLLPEIMEDDSEGKPKEQK